MENYVVSQEFGNVRLDRFLRTHVAGLTQAMIQKWLRKGLIRINSLRQKAADTRVNVGDEITTPSLELNRPKIKRKLDVASPHLLKDFRSWIVFENEDLIVINKPAGMAVQGGTKLKTHLDMILQTLELQGGLKLRLVHRLDKETSGLLILAKDRMSADRLTKQFAHRDIQKSYIALVVGRPDHSTGVIDLALSKEMTASGEKVITDTDNAREAITHYQVLQTLEDISLVLLEPKTGRTHQLRAHCQYGLGTPILGDGKYGGKLAQPFGREEHIFLHSYKLIIPILDQEAIEIVAKPPQHFFQYIKDLAVFA